jgi:Family of unknown function (DUF6174)
MSLSPVRGRRWWLGMPGTLIAVGATLGCSRGEEATAEAVARAEARWQEAGIRDYDLEWTVTGPNNAHYYVTVERGEVSKIDLANHDGGRVELRPAEPRYFSVDGLFLTIANEIKLKESERPFDKPAGTKVFLRFRPDAKLGYPHWYRRDITGTPQTMSIDVVKLTPHPSQRAP